MAGIPRRFAYMRCLCELQTDRISSGIPNTVVSVEGGVNSVSIESNASTISVNGSTPSTGQVLEATGATEALWSAYSPIVGLITMPTNPGAIPGTFSNATRFDINSKGLTSASDTIATDWANQAFIINSPEVDSLTASIDIRRIGNVGYLNVVFTNLDLDNPLPNNQLLLNLPGLPAPVGGPYFGTGCYFTGGVVNDATFADIQLNGTTLAITSFDVLPTGSINSFQGILSYLTSEP